MGLTIHYSLSVAEELSATRVLELVTRARAFALTLPGVEVTETIEVESDFPLAHRFLKGETKPRRPEPPPTGGGDGDWYVVGGSGGEEEFIDVPPENGHVFVVHPGEGSESALTGLCRYPASVRVGRRARRTGLERGWRLAGSCKTQYASQHGWDHFFHCHSTVVKLLDFWTTLGVTLEVTDEGRYWESRSVETLRAELNQMNGLVAAFGGMLKDLAGDEGDGSEVRSPIFDYPEFERLEHEGLAANREKFEAVKEPMKRILNPPPNDGSGG